jgi:hypothetical protein
METVSLIAATMGVAWASGINLYATVFVLGLLGNMGSIDLPPQLELVQNPGVMIAAGVMYLVEFFMDKVPGVDTAWDALHSFIRIPAGALLAAGMVSPVSPSAEFIGLLLGGGLAAGSHFTKAGSRVMINTSPEPFSNWAASITEDVMVVAGLWTALNHPVIFLLLLAGFIALIVWLLPKLWRAVKKVFATIRGWFRRPEKIEPPPAAHEAPAARSDSSGPSP